MSTLKVDTLQTTGGAGLYPSKVWVNFQGTGTVTIRDDGNVSSITDYGAGEYGVNYTSNFSNANYAAVYSSGRVTSRSDHYNLACCDQGAATTSSFYVRAIAPNSSTEVDSETMKYVALN
jgi:hypothetical protein